MTVPLIRSPEFDHDIEGVVGWYIEQKVPYVALRFGRAIDETLALLAQFPEIGSPYETDDVLLQGVRSEIVRGFRNHVLFYRLTDAGLHAMRVFHGRRHIEELL